MNKKVLLLGSGGLVGSAIKRDLEAKGFKDVLAPRSTELNLTRQNDVESYFIEHKPNYVIDAAAKVGGIKANNTYRADFILDNLSIQNNLFSASLLTKPEKFIFLGSSCIYPKNCPQPIKEEYLLTSELEQTNEPYAIAKIAGLKTAESIKRQYGLNFISLMPTNLYGENDNFHPDNSHVIPGLIRRLDEVMKKKEAQFHVWGTGNVKREFLYVDDLATACTHFLINDFENLPYWINVGTGEDITIRELATKVCELMGFKGEIVFDPSQPEGTPRKVLDVSLLQDLNWKAKTNLEEGLKKTIEFYRTSNNVREY